jgi:hypothetical protein
LTFEVGWIGDITNPELDLQSFKLRLSPCPPDGAGDKIHTGNLPTVLGQCNRIRAGTTAQIQCPAGRVGSDEFFQLWRGDTGIPRGLAKVREAKEKIFNEPFEEILHALILPKGNYCLSECRI